MRYPGERDRSGVLRFRRGLLHRALTDLDATIIKGPPAPPRFDPPTAEGLRDFQEEALRLIFTKQWGRIALPTNAGKGAVIALATKPFATHLRSSLVLCDEVAVFGALRAEIEKWTGRTPSLIEAGALNPPAIGAIALAMVPTLSRRVGKEGAWAKWFASVEAVFLDEADKASSPSWQKVLGVLENTHYRIGFSGTFFDEVSPAEQALNEYIGPVLLRMRNDDMIKRGISAKPFVELVPFKHYLALPRVWKDLTGPERRQWIFDNGVVLNVDRHNAILQLLDPNHANAIVVNYIEHGRELLSVIPNSAFLSGSASKETREGVLAQFKKGVFQNLIVSKILDRGSNDLGHTVGLVFASGMGSDRQTLQRIGRGLRRADGKQFLFLKDILDSGHAYFDSASSKRVRLYNEEEFDITIRHL